MMIFATKMFYMEQNCAPNLMRTTQTRRSRRSFVTMAATVVAVGCLALLMEPVSGNNQSPPNQQVTSKSSSSNQQWQLDEMNGAQFVQMVDPLMDGRLSRIIAQVQQYLGDTSKNELPAAGQVTARHYLNLIDKITSGQISSLLRASFPEDYARWQSGSDRFRRASLDTMSGLSLGYSKRSLDPMNGVSFGAPSKRAPNFDEMDRGGFSGFAKRRYNFDEMDRSGFSGFSKRFSSNFDEMDRGGFSGFAKRRYPNNFDELDHSGFSGFAKRYSSNFDEMDRSGFSGFAKRRYGNNFDEMDRSGFSGFFGSGSGRSASKRSIASMMRNKEMARKLSQIQTQSKTKK